jgi:hypothetical protein
VRKKGVRKKGVRKNGVKKKDWKKPLFISTLIRGESRRAVEIT